MNRIGMDELEKVIDHELGDYIKETTSTMREVVEEVTDLLENGHAKQNGGRVEGQKHIEIVEKSAVKSLEDRLRQRL